MPYVALKQPVRHGPRDVAEIPPDSFLDELVAWGQIASDDIFEERGADAVYRAVVSILGPYEGNNHRRAVMLEVMRVLAGHESSWRWNEGVDRHRQKEVKTPTTTEAGAFQVSANSMKHGPDLRHLVLARVGSDDPIQFQRAMKRDHVLAMEYIARDMRITIKANGPVKRWWKNTPPRGIGSNLKRAAVQEFMDLIAPKGSDLVFHHGHWMIPYRSMGDGR